MVFCKCWPSGQYQILENQTQITISGFILKWLQLFKLIRYLHVLFLWFLNVPCIISRLWPQKKDVIMHICLSCCFLWFFSPRTKTFSGYIRKVKSLPEQLNLSGDNFVSGKGAVDPSFCHDELCSLLIVPGSARSTPWELPKSLAGTKPVVNLPSCLGALEEISGHGHWCHGISMNAIISHLWFFFFLFSAGKLEDADEELWVKCQHLSEAGYYCGNGLIP